MAKACPSISEVYVSTDDLEIAAVAKEYGALVPFIRPKELAEDDSPEWKAWQHAINYVQSINLFDIFVSLPATAPLREISDVEQCIAQFKNNVTDLVITVTAARRNPFFNMVKLDAEARASLLMEASVRPEHRQAAPYVYDMTTVAYVARPAFVLTYDSLFDGRVHAVSIPAERAIDIDTELDFRVAEYLYVSNKKGST